MNLSQKRIAHISMWFAMAGLVLATLLFVKNAEQRELDRLYPKLPVSNAFQQFVVMTNDPAHPRVFYAPTNQVNRVGQEPL